MPTQDSIKTEPAAAKGNSGLIPALSFFTTTMLVIGGIIGSGIFRKPGVMAGQVGSPELLLLVWIIAGTITLFGALTNCEIASMFPVTGGQYIYFQKIYGEFFAYLYGWGAFVVFQSGSISAVAYVFAEYASKFFPGLNEAGHLPNWQIALPFIGTVTPFESFRVKSLAAGVIAVLTIINYIGVRFGGMVQNIFTIAKTGAMALLFLAAFLTPNGGSFANLTEPSKVIHPTGIALVLALAAALQGAFWAYDGWNKITYIAGEIRNPQRILPRALCIGVGAVMAIYILLTLAYAYVLPVDQMAATPLVAADVAERCFRGGAKWIAATVMISTLGAANAIILASARVYFSMAEQGVFPKFLGRAHPRFHTPAASLVAQGVWAALLAYSGTFDMLTDTLIFVSWLFYTAGAFGLFVLRKRAPEIPRPFRAPGYPFVPLVFIVFALIFLTLTALNDWNSYQQSVAAGKPAILNFAFGIALILAGTPIYFYYRMKKKSKLGEN